MPRLRLGSERQFGDDRSLARQCLVQSPVFFGVDDIDAAGNDGDAAGFERAQMRGGIDAARQARDDDDAALPERRGEVAAETPAIGRGVARPDHRHDRTAEQLRPPEHGQDRRRVLDCREPARISRLAPADEPRPETLQCGKLGFGVRAGNRGHGLGALPPPRQLRHHFERRAGGAEAAQQRVKADRSDGFGAAQPQPVEALLRIEFACGQCLPQLLPREIRLSVPASSRRMFAWCRAMINKAIPAISSAVGLSAKIGPSAAPATAATSAASEE